MYGSSTNVESVPRGTKIRVRFDMKAAEFIRSLSSQIQANVSQFQSQEVVTQSQKGSSIPFHIPLIELNSQVGVQFTHATVTNVCALFGGVEGRILPSCTVASDGEVRLHIESKDVMNLGNQLSAALPQQGNISWNILNQSGLHVSIGVFMGVHISEFQTWLNQELSSNTPMFPSFYTDYLEFSEEWVQTVFPHRTLPLTGGSKIRSNSETESLASAATGVSEEVRRGSSSASPYGFDAVDAPGAGLGRLSSSSGGLSGIEGLLGGSSATGIADSVSSWDVDADVGVFGALGSGSSSVVGTNLDRAGSVRSGSITSLHSESELGSLSGSMQDLGIASDKGPGAPIPARGPMSYAQASGAGNGGSIAAASSPVKAKAATAAATVSAGGSPSKAWGGQPGSFLAAASAANKSAPAEDSKPPAAPVAAKTNAPRAPPSHATEKSAGGAHGSEVDNSAEGVAERSNWVCPTCKKVVFGRKTSCYKCKTNRPANPVLAPSRPSGAGGGAAGGGAATGGGAHGDNASRKPTDREVRDGDWVCAVCQGHNFANKIACFTCRTPRPDGYVIDKSVEKKSEKKPGDWTCPKCGENVFAKRTRCYTCGTSKNVALGN